MCGIVFEPLPDLDPLVLGVYWDRRRAAFPKRSLQPALTEDAGFGISAFPMRAFLASADDQFVVQLQHDRFFMNWRAVGVEYPRFSERHGEHGLLQRALDEYRTFSEFVAERIGRQPSAVRVELSKIDMLRRGDHWSSLSDLIDLVPVTGVFSDVQQSDEREVNLRFVERGLDGVALVHVATLMQGTQPAALRVEARRVAPAIPTAARALDRVGEVARGRTCVSPGESNIVAAMGCGRKVCWRDEHAIRSRPE